MKMSEEENIALFFNIGNSDVKVDGTKIPQKEVRLRGEKIYQNYDYYKQRLSFELVSPFLERFKEKAKKVFLFVTDQFDPEHRVKDTLYFGELIKNFIEDEYEIECEVKHYEWKPIDYNLSFDYFTKFFKEFDDSTTKIISTSGGVPAMNFSMQTVASSLFSNVEFYSVDEKTHELKHAPIKDILKKELVKRSALELLKRHDYAGINSLLENSKMVTEKIRLFLLYADSRLCFDLESANAKMKEFIGMLPSSLEKSNYESKFTINLSDKSVFFNELFQNMRIKWGNGEYVDFIARLYRFRGALLQNIFEEETNSKIQWEKQKEAKSEFNSILARSFRPLRSQMVENRIIPEYVQVIEPTDRVLHFCFRHFHSQNKSKWGEIWTRFPIILELVDKLRNYSIDAHGYKGVSKADITRILTEKGYDTNRLFQDLQVVVKRFSKEENMFSEINTVLTGFINEL